jgi:hypothetical protein
MAVQWCSGAVVWWCGVLVCGVVWCGVLVCGVVCWCVVWCGVLVCGVVNWWCSGVAGCAYGDVVVMGVPCGEVMMWGRVCP